MLGAGMHVLSKGIAVLTDGALGQHMLSCIQAARHYLPPAQCRTLFKTLSNEMEHPSSPRVKSATAAATVRLRPGQALCVPDAGL